MPKSHMPETREYNIEKLVEEFRDTLDVDWSPPADLTRAAQEALSGCSRWPMHEPEARKKRLLANVNSKLKLSRDRLQRILDEAAALRVFLNYHDRDEVLECLDAGDRDQFRNWIQRKGLPLDLGRHFNPLDTQESLAALHQQLRTGTVKRCDARQCDPSERRMEMLRSLFGGFVFTAFPAQAMHEHFNRDCRTEYHADFFPHLQRFHHDALKRNCALISLVVDDSIAAKLRSDDLSDALCSFVRDSYARLANHCYLAILLKPCRSEEESVQWRLFSDIVLFAEKHRETRLKAGYFEPEKIANATTNHIPNLDHTGAHFEVANEGFLFRDCFVIARPNGNGTVSTNSEPVDLLLLLEKNERDDTLIPCPACRSFNVAGNSYPSFGVRSWECQNPICPDRSAFDRGKRYSLSALIKQQAIKSENDQIPESSLKKWKLDVVTGVDYPVVVDMLVRHFTLHGDTAVLVNSPDLGAARHGRKIAYEVFRGRTHDMAYQDFQESAFFRRFVVERDAPRQPQIAKLDTGIPEAELYQGDCTEVLSTFEAESLDGAVTSPPYYNARSYALWPNIYCYLYDVYNAARQVFRVLKPGAHYLFNVFDYFDNENTLALSAMGQKRMILGAYIVNIFRRVGFQLEGNVVWYKGEIEGKRNFNQGNRSPYYQFPFNCWEHVFVFRKPGPSHAARQFPTILASKPVMKMVRGENVLGHSAPFPASIPDLLLTEMNSGERVLDPFSGSMTTGRQALKRGLRSVSIELHREYCELGLRLLRQEGAESPLFRWAASGLPANVTT